MSPVLQHACQELGMLQSKAQPSVGSLVLDASPPSDNPKRRSCSYAWVDGVTGHRLLTRAMV